MAKSYRLKRHRPRVPRRAALAVAGAGLVAFVWVGAATVHMPAGPVPAGVTATQETPRASAGAAAPTAGGAAKSHHLLAGALAAHRLVHGGGYHRPFWRVRRVRRWFR